MELDILKVKKVFFIGIGGIGISGGAQLMLSRGTSVAGLNDEESPKTLDPLRALGAEIIFSQGFVSLPEADMYVYSDAWIHRGPEIIEEAKKTGKPVLSYFKMLGLVACEYKVIAVSGTHGKTTTTAMIGEILIAAGFDPSVLVGSYVKKFGSNFRTGKSKYLVVEADEYNHHFLNFNPFIGVITNIEEDHLDFYKDLADIENSFKQFKKQSENVVEDYQKYLERVPKLLVPGVHNTQNAAAALATAEVLGIPEDVAIKTLSEFEGTWRRLEKKGETKEGTIVYDDYAHHPTEIRASIEALREVYPQGEKKITILFQPHLYSRTKALFDDFTKSFKGADQVLILPIYFAREAQDKSVSSDKLAEAIAINGEKAEACASFNEAESKVKALNLGGKDVFVTMGAGEAYKVADKLWNLS